VLWVSHVAVAMTGQSLSGVESSAMERHACSETLMFTLTFLQPQVYWPHIDNFTRFRITDKTFKNWITQI